MALYIPAMPIHVLSTNHFSPGGSDGNRDCLSRSYSADHRGELESTVGGTASEMLEREIGKERD